MSKMETKHREETERRTQGQLEGDLKCLRKAHSEWKTTVEVATACTQTEVLYIDPSTQREVAVVLESILDELEKREKVPEPEPPQVATLSRGCQATAVVQDMDNMPSFSSKVPELTRQLWQLRNKERIKKCTIYKDPMFSESMTSIYFEKFTSFAETLKNLFDPKKTEELPQKVAMRAVRAVDLFKAYKKANHIGEIWRTLDAAEKEKWDRRKAQLLKEFLEQLQKGFI
ncbi:hypothetical protein B9Z55_023176 [Caenorhabditis nigoni]|uniref:Uncharacterized protein n=1 Tax=Caenorhabditis nigoni TaxID=1611254 RepID=A0A2G5SNE5_9PELO|nr:hypothetical protein B9Z55_023176 [Caenorhabditis nigoni]